MKDLIKKILLEYSTSELLLEGKATVNVPRDIENKVDGYITQINNGDFGFKGSFKNEKGESFSKLFFLEPTYHYKQRLFRTEEPEYKITGELYDKRIVNPDTFEGIDLIYDNINYIADLVNKNTIKTQRNFVNFYSKSAIPMSVIVLFEKDFLKPKKINMTLITQIKGVRFNRNNTKYPMQVSIGLPTNSSSVSENIMEGLIRRIQKKLGLIT
jgi:hypothetical protein